MYNPDSASDEKILRMAQLKSTTYCKGWIDNIHRRHLVSVIERRKLPFDTSVIPMGPHPEYFLKEKEQVQVELYECSWEEYSQGQGDPLDGLGTAPQLEDEFSGFTYRLKYNLDKENERYSEVLLIRPNYAHDQFSTIAPYTVGEGLRVENAPRLADDLFLRLHHDSYHAFFQRVFERPVTKIYVVLGKEGAPIRAMDFLMEILEIQINRYRRISKMAVVNLPHGYVCRLAGGNPKTRLNPL